MTGIATLTGRFSAAVGTVRLLSNVMRCLSDGGCDRFVPDMRGASAKKTPSSALLNA